MVVNRRPSCVLLLQAALQAYPFFFLFSLLASFFRA